jgi:ElaB/YqjD/DUF883 family membrane-anchored ribosome-binding protein
MPKTSTVETKPTEEDMKSLVNNMNELIKDMPKDPTSTEAQQLKEKIVNNKVDKMLDGL